MDPLPESEQSDNKQVMKSVHMFAVATVVLTRMLQKDGNAVRVENQTGCSRIALCVASDVGRRAGDAKGMLKMITHPDCHWYPL